MRMLLAMLALAPLVPASSDSVLKIVTVTLQLPGPEAEVTEYVARDRRRLEFRNISGERTSPTAPTVYKYGPRMAMIERCDTGQQYEINFDAHEYSSGPGMNRAIFASPRLVARRATPVTLPAPGPTVTVEIATADTGERRQIFGRTARHVITLRKATPSEPAAGQPSESTIDGWFIDLDDVKNCDAWYTSGIGHGYLHSRVLVAGSSAPPLPRVVFKEIGAPEKGFPIEVTVTTNGWPTRPLSRKVTELTLLPLDPSLFEVPSGFYHTNRWDRALMTQAVSAWRRAEWRIRQLLGLG